VSGHGEVFVRRLGGRVVKSLFRYLLVTFCWFVVMSQADRPETVLKNAERLEREYDWLGAIGFYEKALASMSEGDFLAIGDVCERLGYAFHRASMQAESAEEFRGRMRRAVENYGKAENAQVRGHGSIRWLLVGV
jgi:hypothetical protein